VFSVFSVRYIFMTLPTARALRQRLSVRKMYRTENTENTGQKWKGPESKVLTYSSVCSVSKLSKQHFQRRDAFIRMLSAAEFEAASAQQLLAEVRPAGLAEGVGLARVQVSLEFVVVETPE